MEHAVRQDSALGPHVRISGIETMRVFGILAVISIHTGSYLPVPGLPGTSGLIVHLFDQLFIFAVPFFLTASGYFFARSVAAGMDPWRLLLSYGKRLGGAWAIWHLIYVVVPYDWPDTVSREGLLRTVIWHMQGRGRVLMDTPLEFFLYTHLWFLPALLVGLATLALVPARRWRELLPVALAFYVSVLLVEAHDFENPSTALLKDIAMGILFPLIGAWLVSRPVPSRTAAWSLFIGGYLLQTVEAFVLWGALEQPLGTWRGLAGTVPFGVGAFLIGLTYRSWGQGGIAMLGRFSLGVYCAHWVLINSLSPLRPLLTGTLTVGLFVFPLLVYAGSCCLVMILQQSSITAFAVGGQRTRRPSPIFQLRRTLSERVRPKRGRRSGSKTARTRSRLGMPSLRYAARGRPNDHRAS